MQQITIDPEFQALIPPLSAEERAQLEANLLADGCRDPLVVWVQPAPEPGRHKCYAHDESKCDLVPEDDVWHCLHCEHNPAPQEYVLIDGHNRYEISTRHGLPFDTVEVEFADREEAMDWIDANQLGRRNLAPEERTRLIGRRYNRAKKKQGAPTGNTNAAKQIAQNEPVVPTAKIIGDQHGVSPATVKRAGQYDAAATVIEQAGGSVAGAAQQDVVKAAEVVRQVPEAAQDVELAADFARLPDELKQDALEAIAVQAPAAEVMREAVKKAHVANNSGNNEWYTPADYIALAREVMGGIDTDPATSEIANRTVQAIQIFTAEDNGLTKQWSGRVWCNPPYAQPLIAEFSEAIASKYESGEIEQACVLVNNGTETAWFQRMLKAASAVCFPRSRIRFVDPEGNPSGAPLQGQAVLYLGDETEAFASVFSEKGAVLFNA